MTDANGCEIQVGDSVVCDRNADGSKCADEGVVTSFGGIGIFVRSDRDGETLDWAQDQVEKL